MNFTRNRAVRTGTHAARGILLLVLSGTGVTRAEPVRQFAQRDIAPVGSVTRPVPWPDTRSLRPAAVVREHRKAQRIIDRVCTGC